VFNENEVKPIPSVWSNASWIIQAETKKENTLEGFPAYYQFVKNPFRPWSLFFSEGISAGWTGASKLVVNSGEIVEYTEAFGYRSKKNLDLETFDSMEVRMLPNQYWLFLGWVLSLTFWLTLLGLPIIIWSFWKKHTYLIMYFGMKSTTNIPILIRIEGDDKAEKITQFQAVLDEAVQQQRN